MAGLISPTTVEQIRAASDIVDVIGGYGLPLKHAGANFVTLCPFHKEKTPSFNVSPHKQIFHCFGCHKGGDVFTFVQEYENISLSKSCGGWRIAPVFRSNTIETRITKKRVISRKR